MSPEISSGQTTLVKRERPYSRPGWGTTTWTIRPQRPIPADKPVVLRFSYNGGGERTSFIFSLGMEVCFGAGIATAWYPEVEDLPLDSNGRLRGLRGTGNIAFTVPRGFIRTVRVRGMVASFSFPVNFRAKSVTLDPHYVVLRWTQEQRNAGLLLRLIKSR